MKGRRFQERRAPKHEEAAETMWLPLMSAGCYQILTTVLLVFLIVPTEISPVSIQQQHDAKLVQHQINGQPVQNTATMRVKQVLPTEWPAPPVQVSSREIEKQIVDRILGEGYDKRIRPAGSGVSNTTKSGEYLGMEDDYRVVVCRSSSQRER